jgi:hypothetical protein
MSQGVMHIADARGRKVPPLDPFQMRLLRRHDVIEAETLKKIAEDVGPGIEKWPRIAVIVGVVGIALAFGILGARMVQLAVQTGAFPLEDFIDRAPTFIALVPGLVIHWFIAKQTRCRRVKKVMLAHRRCPHCGYDLRDLPADEDDGATICPECGCAWRMTA